MNCTFSSKDVRFPLLPHFITLMDLIKIVNLEALARNNMPTFNPTLPLERELGKQIYQALQGPVVETILQTAKDGSGDDYWRSHMEGHCMKYDLPDGTPHEKGIDVWFALETLELAMYRDFDFVVMITGDADYEMLARKLKSLKIPAILLSWHYDDQDPTAKALKDEISFQININSLLKVDPSLSNFITEAASL